jgi:hypothetical protein
MAEAEEECNMSQVAGDGAHQFQARGNMTVHLPINKTRLTVLYESLNEEFNSDNRIDDILEELQSYTNNRDVIGLEQKLIDGEKEHLYETVSWYKQEYSKKLERFQYYPSAQRIHSLILAIVLEKFHAHISPLIRSKEDEVLILEKISELVVTPIYTKIENDGCQDIMGLTIADINGMIYFLTGKCHIKWT